MIHVKPINNFIVLHPVSFERIPPEGMDVQDSTYWTRRKSEGAVEITAINQITGNE